VDAAFAAFVPPLNVQTRDVAEAIVRVNARHPGKPLLAAVSGEGALALAAREPAEVLVFDLA